VGQGVEERDPHGVMVPFTEAVAATDGAAEGEGLPETLTRGEGVRDSRGDADALAVPLSVAERPAERDAEGQLEGAPLELGDRDSPLLKVAVPHGEGVLPGEREPALLAERGGVPLDRTEAVRAAEGEAPLEGEREGAVVRERAPVGEAQGEGVPDVCGDSEPVPDPEGTSEAVGAVEGDEDSRAEGVGVADCRGEPELLSLGGTVALAMEALGRPEVEGRSEAVAAGLAEGDAVSEARMGMLTMQECTPTARKLKALGVLHCGPAASEAVARMDTGAAKRYAFAAAAAAEAVPEAITCGHTARPGVSPPPSMMVYPLGPTAALLDALATLTTSEKVVPAFSCSRRPPIHERPTPGCDVGAASGSPGHSGK
jgi:hypothetical protein